MIQRLRLGLPYPSWLRPVIGLATAIVVFFCLFKYVAAFASTYTDDAFIQLKYADTLVKYHSWGFFAGRVTNTATSPLNVLATALFGLFANSIVSAATWLTAVEFCLMLVVLCLISKKLFSGYYFGAFAFVALAANPLLLSTLGLESVLFTLLFLISLYCFTAKRWYRLALSLGFLTLTRADGALLFFILLIALPVSLGLKWRFAVAYVLVLIPWHLFSWVHLGSLVPDTLFIKTRQAEWATGVSFPNGLGYYYLRRFPVATLTSFFLLPLGALALRQAQRPVKVSLIVVGSYGALHYLAYSLIRVPPYHWYYIHLMLACVLLGSLGLGCWMERAARGGGWWRAGACLSLLVPAAGLIVLAQRDGFPFREAPIHTNWATQAQYEAVGLWLRDHIDPAATIEMAGEIGTLAYYSDRYLINNFSSPEVIRGYAGRYARWPVVRTALDVNFFWRHEQDPLPPASYVLKHVPRKHDKQEGPSILMSWPTSSKWIPDGRLYLSTAP